MAYHAPDWGLPRLPNGLIDRESLPYMCMTWPEAIAKANSRGEDSHVRQSVRQYEYNFWVVTRNE